MSTRTLPDIDIRGTMHPDRGYCYDSGYEGPTIHTVYCTYGARDTAMSSSTCIRSDQDGAAIKAARDARAEERRFTPPEYRDPLGKPARRKPGPIIPAASGQVTERVALRGRPRGTGDDDWATWETYTEVDPEFNGFYLAEHLHMVAKRMSAKEAKAIVAEFAARVPHYEFKIVRARLVVEEEILA